MAFDRSDPRWKRQQSDAISRTMRRRIRRCMTCQRGQNPRFYKLNDGRTVWKCRFCEREHAELIQPTAGTPARGE